MAAIDWPWGLTTIEWQSYERGADPDVERTSFDDGSVRQARTVSKSYDLRRFTIVVKQDDKANFDDWLRSNGNDFFNFRDLEDRQIRDARIRGGRGSVRLIAVEGNQRLDGQRFWRGTVELEGYW